MIHRDRITENQLLAAFSEMNPIDLVELRDAFAAAGPRILELERASTGS